MEERRKLKRNEIMFYSSVYDLKTGKHLGYLGNMTIDGIMIIGEEPVDDNVVVNLRIDVPENTYIKSVLKFEAISLWCEPDIDPKYHNTGFKITKIIPEDLAIIKKIVQDYTIREL
jgi:hypothetical protein